MDVELSAELLRLLSILSDRPSGATKHELTVIGGVRAGFVYRAIAIDLVQVHRFGKTYRFFLSSAGRGDRPRQRAAITPSPRARRAGILAQSSRAVRSDA